MIELHKYLSIK